MEEPELVYCEALIDSGKDVQPPPLPKRRESFAAASIELNSVGRLPPPTIIRANSCQKSQNSSSWKRQVVLTIAVTIFAIISMVFMSLYFIAEAKMTKCSGNTERKSTGCSDLYKKGERIDGVYTIDPDGLGPFEVRCDMTTNGGGWTIFQRRIDGSVDFYLGWDDYKKGFGNPNGEFWLGLDKIHRLTKSGQNILRVDLENFHNRTVYAEYRAFAVGNEIEKYKLTVGGYSGNAVDSLKYQNGMMFTTKDEDNDKSNEFENCAVHFKSAWWYNNCNYSDLNGLHHHDARRMNFQGVVWATGNGYVYFLKKTEMKVRPPSF